MSTAELAQRVTEVAAALKDHTDLPQLRSIGIWDNDVILRTVITYGGNYPWSKFIPIADWAQAFDGDVEISLGAGLGDVNGRITLAGHKVRVTDSINSEIAYQFGRVLQQMIGPKHSVVVTPLRFRQAVAQLIAESTSDGAR